MLLGSRRTRESGWCRGTSSVWWQPVRRSTRTHRGARSTQSSSTSTTLRHLLHPSHAGFYTVDGLRRLSSYLHPGGVFGLWSDDPPDQEFVEVLAQVFVTTEAHVVTFPNPLTGAESANTVYVSA